MRKNIILLVAILVSYVAQGQDSKLILNKIIAHVGSEHIMYSDLQELYSYALAKQPGYSEDFQCTILEQLVNKALMVDQARLDSIIIDESEINTQLDRRIEYILAQMNGDEEQFYSYYGKTPREQKEIMRAPLREELLQQRVQGHLIQNITITPNEVVEFYHSLHTDSIPFLSAEVELREIVVKTMISKEEKQKAIDKLQKVKNRIVNEGEDFAELASIFSDDLGSARSGGDLGWVKRGTLVPEFEATAYNLEENEISEIIETQFGYHLLQLLGRRGNSIHVRHILIRPEETQEDIDATKLYLDSIRQQILVDSLPFELAVRIHSDRESQSYNNAGRLSNPQTGDTFWEMGDLPFPIYQAIEEHGISEIGDVSEVLEFEERGDKVFKIIQLVSRTKPHQASLKSDYIRIQQYAKDSKKNEHFNRWMEDKIKRTHIVIDSAFEGCPNLALYQWEKYGG